LNWVNRFCEQRLCAKRKKLKDKQAKRGKRIAHGKNEQGYGIGRSKEETHSRRRAPSKKNSRDNAIMEEGKLSREIRRSGPG